MRKIVKVFVLTFTVVMAGNNVSQASLLQLSHEPLFLNQTVPPAIAVTLDDSGSMYWSYMGPSGSNGTDFTNPMENTLYFNPNITYSPPLNANGTPFPNSNPRNAKVDGYPNNMNDTVDLRSDYIAIRRFVYNRWDDNVRIGFVDTQEKDINDINALYENYHPDWSGDRAYYSRKNTNGSYTTVSLYGDDLKNFANWYTYYNSRAKLARAAISRSFQGFGPSFKIAWQELNRTTTFSNLDKFEFGHKNNFFNWLFKAPTSGGTPLRSAFKRAGDLFTLDSSYYSADFGANLSCQQNFHIAISDGGWNGDSGYNSGTDGFLQDETANGLPGDTENRYGNYTGTGEQVIYSKSESGSTLSDIAFNSWARDLNPNLNNNVKRFKKDYRNAAGVEITFAADEDEWDNEAFVWNPQNDPAYWQHLVTYNVGMGLEASRIRNYENGNTTCPQIPAITDPKEAVYTSLRNGDCGWPNADNESTTKIDDVWHSSINSRGQFFSANDPNELIAALNNVVNNILEKQARGGTSTVSSGVITGDSLAFSPSFDSSTWSGNLIARDVGDGGTFDDVAWDLSCNLTGGGGCTKQNTRNFYTVDPSNGSLIEFDTSLTGNLRTLLQTNADDLMTRSGATVDQIIEYVKGDQTQEAQQLSNVPNLASGGSLRSRTSVLSDIIHSSPALVRGPGENYSDVLWPESSPEFQAAENDSGYVNYKEARLDRNEVIYIGSNSGVLHAVDSTDGEELWAYMPSKAFENIHLLPDPEADHHSYVDNSVVTRDVFINGQWRTVLIGGMRYGGQAFFALDITDANSSQPKLLWEFTDQNDVDLGFTYGKAEIVRVSSTGEWVALLPNGYNNSQQDYPNGSDPRNRISTSGTSVLYVVRISDGQLLAKIDTNEGDPTTPNGMATATGVDSEFIIGGGANRLGSKIDLGIDFAYAGDLYGNLWRFDMTSSSYSNWTANKVISADTNMHRPITIKPRVLPIPDLYQSQENDVMVMFGTGKYIELPDRDSTLPAHQYFVGVIDGNHPNNTGNYSILDGGFVNQPLTIDNDSSGNLPDPPNPVDFTSDLGWKIRLTQEGERVTNDMSLFGSQVLLGSTTVTAGIDPCEGGGVSWLYAIDPLTGGEPEPGKIFEGSYDIDDGNGNIITVDFAASAIKVNVFIVGPPPLLERLGGGILQAIIEGSNDTTIITLQKQTWRRRNWTNLLTE